MITKLMNIQAWTTISGAQQLQINFGLTPQTTFLLSKSEFTAQPLRHFVSNTSTHTHARTHAHTRIHRRKHVHISRHVHRRWERGGKGKPCPWNLGRIETNSNSAEAH